MPFEELPEDWISCMRGKYAFEKEER